MAVKTITIDMDAYRMLAAEKNHDESFSRVIKRRMRHGCTAKDLLEHLGRVALGNDALNKTAEILAARKRSPARSPVMERR